MLFEILKAMGIDVPAAIERLEANFDLRLEQATAQVSRVAQHAVVLTALYSFAAVAALLAVGLGLFALDLRVAEAYGVYAGLAIVGAILLAIAAVLGSVAFTRSNSFGGNKLGGPPPVFGATVLDRVRPSSGGAPAVNLASATAAAPEEAERPSASEVVEPLAVFLSKFTKYPSTGKPIVDELFDNLSATTPGVAEKVLDRAANAIRQGDRANILMVLTGAAFVGWLMARHSGRKLA